MRWKEPPEVRWSKWSKYMRRETTNVWNSHVLQGSNLLGLQHPWFQETQYNWKSLLHVRNPQLIHNFLTDIPQLTAQIQKHCTSWRNSPPWRNSGMTIAIYRLPIPVTALSFSWTKANSKFMPCQKWKFVVLWSNTRSRRYIYQQLWNHNSDPLLNRCMITIPLSYDMYDINDSCVRNFCSNSYHKVVKSNSPNNDTSISLHPIHRNVCLIACVVRVGSWEMPFLSTNYVYGLGHGFTSAELAWIHRLQN